MRRLAPAFTAALAAALLAAGCGGSGGTTAPAPKGPPSARHHGKAADYLTDVERTRAGLVAAADLVYIIHPVGARDQVQFASKAYAPLSADVAARIPALDREIRAAFGTNDQLIARRAPFASLQVRLGLVQGQLLDAAYGAISSEAARSDPGVQAVALDRLNAQMASSYAAAARNWNTARGRQQYETAWGLFSRVQALWRAIGAPLGPQKNAVGNALDTIRTQAFPFGAGQPHTLSPKPAAVAAQAAKIHAAVGRRFGM
ncbi:MAG: hypothetical protein ACJ76V_15935 [Thermoleophilaceae bacterium]